MSKVLVAKLQVKNSLQTGQKSIKTNSVALVLGPVASQFYHPYFLR